MTHFLLQPFENFVKISSFTGKLIKKCCSGDRVIDLLFHFPSSVQNRSGNINDFSEKDKLTVTLKIVDHMAPRSPKYPYKIIGQTPNGDFVTIVYFNYNAVLIRKTLPFEGVFTVSGTAKKTADGIQITHPDVIAAPNMQKYYIGIEPIYPLVSKLTNRTMIYVIKSLLQVMPDINDLIPEKLLKEYELMTFSNAIRTVHNPKIPADVLISSKARERIAIDELLINQIRLRQIRASISQQNTQSFTSKNTIIQSLQLPFQLTEDQLSCLDDIKRDLSSEIPMNRLIQGDVGSGKTIIAFISMLVVLENGAQAAMLVPTEILALQHFTNIKKMLPKIKIDIMLASNRSSRAKQIDLLKSGETQILIGTHAILEDNIEFKNLGLAVIDEQHRFGVMQRLALIKKSHCQNILAMSATPIPRTLLLGCYGDLDVSSIKTKPQGRKPIETVVIGVSKIEDLIERLKKVDSQVYWVCPVIEESENLTDINTRCDYLSKQFSTKDVAILHGKMKPKEKDEIMSRFKNGEFRILVSTTVIEVGVDIPSANVIVIEHAERFGLAQLHQLRGRVGRGSDQSYCILLYHNPVSTVGKQRLQLMKSTTDGFLISEEDLKLRGAGDILGKEQSGFQSLRFSDFASNDQLIQIADKISSSIELDSDNITFLYKLFSRIHEDVVA
ncbi:MAG: ATP-dependent DNA helicase RecG [Holosporaceae bacterium]|jgi:ATP-dependent DNA helicase RecG|nr:ATP-dependent DNA helicase RecG [Holosporaceae bacterium]